MDLRKLLAFGTGVGMEIGSRNLEAAVARVRPSGIDVLGRITIANFRERPAAEWGAEYAGFLKRLGGNYLSATVLLPRSEIIVRYLALPGVAAKDRAAAISFQLDTLHPYGEDDVNWGWSELRPDSVLVGIMRRAALERYLDLFAEAGLAVAAFTFSAAAIHAAVRLVAPPPADLLAVHHAEGAVEIYGESQARPIFSAEFQLPVERATALAAAELRLAPEIAPLPLAELLPPPRVNPIENDLSRNALPYATALAGACPRLAPAANLLPIERRSSNSRAMFIPTAIAAGLLLVVASASLGYSRWADSRYLGELNAEAARLQPVVKRLSVMDAQMDKMHARTRLLDEFRGRTSFDLETLNELSRLLPPPTWANSIELNRNDASISGETDQAAPLLKLLDGSPYFQNSEFNVIARVGSNELFRIHTQREARK